MDAGSIRDRAVPDARRGVLAIPLADLEALGVTPLDALACGVVPALWVRSAHSLNAEALARLARARVLVVGAGGLGGYLLELVARAGVGFLRIVDGDAFEETNMNRQLLAEPATLGRWKVEVAAERLVRVAPFCQVDPRAVALDAANAPSLFAGMDLVVDCLGGVDVRRPLHETAAAAGLPIVAAAVAGWTAVVGSERPGMPGISLLWQDEKAGDAEEHLGSLAPTVALAASLQAAEVVRFLATGELSLAGKLLHADLSSWEFSLYHLT